MSRRTVLIVEDERALAEVLAFNLESEGYEVQTARDGRDGLSKARSLLPDPRDPRRDAAGPGRAGGLSGIAVRRPHPAACAS